MIGASVAMSIICGESPLTLRVLPNNSMEPWKGTKIFDRPGQLRQDAI